jgi:hypothetical protein
MPFSGVSQTCCFLYLSVKLDMLVSKVIYVPINILQVSTQVRFDNWIAFLNGLHFMSIV